MAFRSLLGKGLWTAPSLGGSTFPYTGGSEYPLTGLAGFTTSPAYSPTASRSTNYYGDRWVLSFWFKIDGNQQYVSNWRTYNGVNINYTQDIACNLGGPRVWDSSGTVVGTNWTQSALNLRFLGSSNTDHFIRILYYPTFSQGNLSHTIGPYQPDKWYNLTIAYNVTYQGQPNRFVARLIAQDGSIDKIENKAVVYGTSGSPRGYRTFSLDYVQWGLLYQNLPGDDGISYNNVVTKPTIYGNNIVAHWDRVFLDTYSLSDSIVFENYFNSVTSDQNLVRLPSRFAPLMGSDYNNIYPLNNNPPVYYLFKSGTQFGDNTNLPAPDLTFNSSYNIQDSDGPRIGNVFGSASLASTVTSNFQGRRLRSSPANLQVTTKLVAAPGKTHLGQALLNESFATETLYIDDSYFNDIYVKGVLDADVLLGGVVKAEVSSELSATANVFYSADSALEVYNLAFVIPEILLGDESAISADFDTQIIAGFEYHAESSLLAEVTQQVQGNLSISSLANLDSNFADSLTGNMRYDVGIQYAVDWVNVEDEYVLPYYYLGLSVDSSVECLPTLLKIAEAALLASSTCLTQAGFLKQLEADVLASSAIDSITGVIINSTQALFDADFSSQQLGGRVYNIDEDLAFDFQANFQGNRIVSDTLTEIASDTAIDSVIDLFSGAQSFVSADFNSKIVGGFFLALPLQQYYSQFTMPPTVARIIVLDEYYIDLVVPESRQLFIPVEPRTFISNSEQRQIQVHYEPTTMIVSEETRINKPELGRSYLAGRRTRRVAV